MPLAISVGGTDQITKTGLEDTCGGLLTPVGVAGTVSHSAGASAFVLSDGFSQFPGSANRDGTFTIPAKNTLPHLGAPVLTSFQNGRFTADGFDARVTLDIDGPAAATPFAACRVTQSWHGTKQGGANVIPS